MLRKARSKVTLLLAGSLSGLSLLGAAGCSHSTERVWDAEALRYEPFTVNSPSVVLGRPLEFQAQETGQGSDTAALADGRAWWATRNDGRLGVREDAGYRPVGGFAVEVYDRQSSYGDVIRNSYRRTFRGVEIGRIYR